MNISYLAACRTCHRRSLVVFISVIHSHFASVAFLFYTCLHLPQLCTLSREMGGTRSHCRFNQLCFCSHSFRQILPCLMSQCTDKSGYGILRLRLSWTVPGDCISTLYFLGQLQPLRAFLVTAHSSGCVPLS